MRAPITPFNFSSRFAKESQSSIELEQCLRPKSYASLAHSKRSSRSSSYPSINRNLKNEGNLFNPSSSNFLSSSTFPNLFSTIADFIHALSVPPPLSLAFARIILGLLSSQVSNFAYASHNSMSCGQHSTTL
ncbi:hypothetical protein Pyn_11877 [Prunus yedoensis var. nudiflora]|uniref:Uncharacterized protein n=1 Tax=Prunus yedoensis var. nudiflora TaxID=2094558 RepID=A0A314YDF3_PRUYE|nr:hypothetical protein Pyn_11877 [Prunus yedoensis var. nudiflora]